MPLESPGVMELIYWNWILRDSRWDAKGKNPIHIWRKVQYSFEKWNWRRRNPKMEFCLVGDLASHMRILNVSKKNLKFQKQGNHRRHVSDKWSMRQPRCRAWGSRKLGTRRTGSLDHPIHTLPSPLHYYNSVHAYNINLSIMLVLVTYFGLFWSFWADIRFFSLANLCPFWCTFYRPN